MKATLLTKIFAYNMPPGTHIDVVYTKAINNHFPMFLHNGAVFSTGLYAFVKEGDYRLAILFNWDDLV